MNIMKFFGFENDGDDYDDNDDYTEDRRKKSRSSRDRTSPGKLIVYNYNSATLDRDKNHLREEFIDNSAMILVDLHELNQREYDEEGKDFITFMGGLAYARKGDMKFIPPSQFLFTPAVDMCEIWPEGSDKE